MIIQVMALLRESDIFLVLSNQANINVVRAAGNAVNNSSRLIKDEPSTSGPPKGRVTKNSKIVTTIIAKKPNAISIKITLM